MRQSVGILFHIHARHTLPFRGDTLVRRQATPKDMVFSPVLRKATAINRKLCVSQQLAERHVAMMSELEKRMEEERKALRREAAAMAASAAASGEDRARLALSARCCSSVLVCCEAFHVLSARPRAEDYFCLTAPHAASSFTTLLACSSCVWTSDKLYDSVGSWNYLPMDLLLSV